METLGKAFLTRTATFYRQAPHVDGVTAQVQPYLTDVPCTPVMGENRYTAGFTHMQWMGSLPAEEKALYVDITPEMRNEHGHTIIKNGHYVIVDGHEYVITSTNEFDIPEFGLAYIDLALKEVQ